MAEYTMTPLWGLLSVLVCLGLRLILVRIPGWPGKALLMRMARALIHLVDEKIIRGLSIGILQLPGMLGGMMSYKMTGSVNRHMMVGLLGVIFFMVLLWTHYG